MCDIDEYLVSDNTAYLTPPLSPTKTISTEGWLSPRTPASPRKTRSCFFIRDFDHDADFALNTPPSSPRKSKLTSGFGALSIPSLLPATHTLTPSLSDDNVLIEAITPCKLDRLPLRSATLARSYSHSSPVTPKSSISPPLDFSVEFEQPAPCAPCQKSMRHRSGRSISESPLTTSSRTSSTTHIFSTGDTAVHESPTSISPADCFSPPKIHCLPLRHVSSPLRSGQWTARGGLMSSPCRVQTSANSPDRFIATRRPPADARESFELNKPAQRLETEHITSRVSHRGLDAFSHRLRRSGRMNDELRSLREAHSVILGRANAARRSRIARRSSIPRGPRQVSAGAIWNVGGPSAVSNTVVGVSTGRDSMLGSGTNAPLYRSAFLNRADPEAELEAYERRLALALDVDQTDRILQHTPFPFNTNGAMYASSPSYAKHVWRDGAWIRDGVNPCLSS